MNTSVLVTGAQGFVGRYLVERLLSDKESTEVIGVGRSEKRASFTHEVTWNGKPVVAPLTSPLSAIAEHARYTYLQADIRDASVMRSIVAEYKPNTIFQLASGLRDDPPSDLFSTNVVGTIAFLEAVSEAGYGGTIIIGSSGSVYGAPQRLPVDEESSTEPRDHYAVSKLAAEYAARVTARDRRLRIVYARIFNIIGPGADERHAPARFSAQLAAIVNGSEDRRLRIGDLSPTRDLIDVRDVAAALVRIARAEPQDEIYNVASGTETPMSTVLNTLLKLANVEQTVAVESTYVRPSDIPRVVADITRLRSTGHAPQFPLERSLRDMLTYYTQTVASAEAARSQL